jgi:hypothetical protein
MVREMRLPVACDWTPNGPESHVLIS